MEYRCTTGQVGFDKAALVTHSVPKPPDRVSVPASPLLRRLNILFFGHTPIQVLHPIVVRLHGSKYRNRTSSTAITCLNPGTNAADSQGHSTEPPNPLRAISYVYALRYVNIDRFRREFELGPPPRLIRTLASNCFLKTFGIRLFGTSLLLSWNVGPSRTTVFLSQRTSLAELT